MNRGQNIWLPPLYCFRFEESSDVCKHLLINAPVYESQVVLAVTTVNWSWPAYLTVVYVVGATANHSLFLAIHELSHNLGFKSIRDNKLCAMLANLPIGIPYCITFKPYHMEHHRFQGDNGETGFQVSHIQARFL